jgi:hypothetical protein
MVLHSHNSKLNAALSGNVTMHAWNPNENSVLIVTPVQIPKLC